MFTSHLWVRLMRSDGHITVLGMIKEF